MDFNTLEDSMGIGWDKFGRMANRRQTDGKQMANRRQTDGKQTDINPNLGIGMLSAFSCDFLRGKAY